MSANRKMAQDDIGNHAVDGFAAGIGQRGGALEQGIASKPGRFLSLFPRSRRPGVPPDHAIVVDFYDIKPLRLEVAGWHDHADEKIVFGYGSHKNLPDSLIRWSVSLL